MSIKCVQCRGPVPEVGGVVVSGDGDFACSKDCAELVEGETRRQLNLVADLTVPLCVIIGRPRRTAQLECRPEAKVKNACPCCGYLTSDKLGSICAVCFWTHDDSCENGQSRVNGNLTLEQGRKQYRNHGVYAWRYAPCVRQPRPHEIPSGLRKGAL